MNTIRGVLEKIFSLKNLTNMKDPEEIFLVTARTLSENPKIKINFKKEDRKNEEFFTNEINFNDKREINRGVLDHFSFFERYLENKPFKFYEPKISNLKILYNYLHHSRAHYLAINEFPGVFINLAEYQKFIFDKKKQNKDNPEDFFFYNIYLFCLEKFIKKKILKNFSKGTDFKLFYKYNSDIFEVLNNHLENHKKFSKISKELCERLINEDDRKINSENDEKIETQPDILKKNHNKTHEETKKIKRFYFENKQAPTNKKETSKEPLSKKQIINKLQKLNSYKFFTNKFDKIVNAEKLCSKDEIFELRQKLLDEFPKLDHVIKKLATKLEKKLLSKQIRSWEFNLEEGILDVSRISRRIINPLDDQIFKKENDLSAKNTIVTLLIDNSGSMRGRPIITAVNAVEVLAKTLEKCGVKIEILGFTTREWKGGESRKYWKEKSETPNPGRLNDLLHIIYKDSEKRWKSSSKNLGLVLKEGLLKENIDGEALLWAEKRLMLKAERKKILIVISDGAPVDDSTLSANESNILEEHLKEVILKIEKKNVIDLLAIGIGHDVSKYYSRAITIDDANKLAEVMLQKLTGIFSKN